MGTSNPRPRGAPSVSGELAKARSDREQMRRMIARTPRAAPVATGGAYIGVAQVQADPASIVTGGGQDIQTYTVSYAAPIDPLAGTKGESSEDVSTWCTVNGNEIDLTEGYYDVTVSVEVAWATASHSPDSFSALVDHSAPVALLWPEGSQTVWDATTWGSKRGFSQHLQHPGIYVTGPLHFELQWGAYTGGSDPLVGLTSTTPSIVWTIRRKA